MPAASAKSSPALGKSGMKMTGPYDRVPPNYGYARREGGATGLNSETGETREVVVVNNRHDAATGLTARVSLHGTPPPPIARRTRAAPPPPYGSPAGTPRPGRSRRTV
ncbi:hypothetical protein AB0E27_26125 [Streptomyces sparsogenes]|uniref:hypothetical protein n=1 Tax=Streptomyces sparsogenes TaxID=67365 RepID=UPI0033C24A8E